MLGKTVFLGDFGLAIRAGTSVGFKLQGPFEYCAPERFHDVDPSPASDMWSYMCMFAELYFGFPPFQGSGNGYTSTMKTINRLGPLPEQWKERYHDVSSREDSWYDESRTAKRGIDLEAMVHRFRSDASLSERSDVVSLMAKGFGYLPQDRITAEDLLDDEVFKKIMDYHQL